MIHISVLPLLAFFGLALLPLWGHQHQPIHPNIQQRLHQVDVSLHLRQYEQLKMHAFEARMKLELLNLNAVRDDELFHGKMLEKKSKSTRRKSQSYQESAFTTRRKIERASRGKTNAHVSR